MLFHWDAYRLMGANGRRPSIETKGEVTEKAEAVSWPQQQLWLVPGRCRRRRCMDLRFGDRVSGYHSPKAEKERNIVLEICYTEYNEKWIGLNVEFTVIPIVNWLNEEYFTSSSIDNLLQRQFQSDFYHREYMLLSIGDQSIILAPVENKYELISQ